MVSLFAAAAASWGVAMAVAPLLQVQKIRRSRSSANVSVAYQVVLLIGFVLWLAYGIAAGNVALVVPNVVSVIVGSTTVAVSRRYRDTSMSRERPTARARRRLRGGRTPTSCRR